MKKHQIALVLELIFILLPITFISCFGATYIIGIGLGEKIKFNPIETIIVITITVLCLVAILSLWYLTISSIRINSMKQRPLTSFIYFPSHIGAILAILSVFSLCIYLLNPTLERPFGYIAIYAYGAPALIPYLHSIYVNKYADKSLHPDVAKLRGWA